MDVSDLVSKSKIGDGEAFSTLIKAYEKDLYRVAIAILKNDDDALDCIQDTILKAYESIGKLKKEEYFKTWLIKILINSCNTLINKRKRVIPIKEAFKEDGYRDNTEKIEINEFVDKLEEELRVLVILYYFEDLSVKDISKYLKIPEGTIKSRLSRAREKLKTLMNCDCKEMI